MSKMKMTVKLPELKVDEEGKVLLVEVVNRINYIEYLKINMLSMIGPKYNFVNGEGGDYLTEFTFEAPENKTQLINQWLHLEFENNFK